MEHKRYRWMYTSSGKLVFGGKNAEQNEEVVQWLIKETGKGMNYIVMHTQLPGSPFTVLTSEKYDSQDLEECAIFCACYSRAWRDKKKRAVVDIFHSSQLFKGEGMKTGTFGVVEKSKSVTVSLKLCLAVQDNMLRGIPYQKGGKSCLICLEPGHLDKEKTAELTAKTIGFKKQEVLEALPTGGFRITTCR